MKKGMKNNDDATSSPKWTTSQHQTKNPGLIKRFLNWLAGGTDNPGMNGPTCST